MASQQAVLCFFHPLSVQRKSINKKIKANEQNNTCAKYSSAILSAQTVHSERGLAGLLTSAHLISILLITAVSIAPISPLLPPRLQITDYDYYKTINELILLIPDVVDASLVILC